MKKHSFGELKSRQESLTKYFIADDKVDEVKYIAGFGLSFFGQKCVCAATVFDMEKMEIVERKIITAKPPMNYVPGFRAFREGPIICQAYYDLEYEPDVIIVSGNGIAHPDKTGIATFVGVELGKPVIGVAKKLAVGEEKEGSIIFEDQLLGKVVRTKEHANPLYVSPGNMISVERAEELVKRCVIPPHKLPEPLHAASRMADKHVAKNLKEKKMIKKEEMILA